MVKTRKQIFTCCSNDRSDRPLFTTFVPCKNRATIAISKKEAGWGYWYCPEHILGQVYRTAGRDTLDRWLNG